MSSLAQIADVVGAVAIVLSLLFLAYELHQTRKQAELSNWREVLQALVEFKAATNDLSLADAIVRGREDYAALSDAERLSFGLYLEQAVHIYGNFLKHNDSLPRKLDGLETALANSLYELLTSPGGAAWWAEAQTRRRFMANTFLTVNSLLARREANAGKPLT